MATKNVAWNNGTGSITAVYDGSGDGTIQITSDPNNLYEARSQQITVKTTDGSNITRTVTIQQAAKVRIDISSAVVTAANQTYSGSAKTPTPTVTLNGETIPSSGYDVAYSDNINAGTATITITGKDDYTGTATGTFTIAKANPTYTAPTARTNLTYSGSSQYLVTAGSTSHGTIQYSSNGTAWSTTRPSSTNAGSYTTYWRLVGDSNHNDVASTSLSTTIAKASRTLSFADAYVVLNTSSNITKTATPSAGSGDGAITYSISSTTYATINSSTGAVTSKTSDGSATVTATIAEGANYLSATASYTLYVFATVHNFSYTGSQQSKSLPPGSYKLQVWGAQGGGLSSYSKTGGKGGYSEGVLTISSSKTVYVNVGGQGSENGTGGANGGGGGQGTLNYRTTTVHAMAACAGGGGGTDIATVSSTLTNRSDASLKSRMIVAGGGSGAGYGYLCNYSRLENLSLPYGYTGSDGATYLAASNMTMGSKYIINLNDTSKTIYIHFRDNNFSLKGAQVVTQDTVFTLNTVSDATVIYVVVFDSVTTKTFTATIDSVSSENSGSYNGHVGGGTNGGATYATYKGTQSAAGKNASFGKGANQLGTAVGVHSGMGGGGWYGGGCDGNTAGVSYADCSGGGSGWVNTSASSGNRPSGYTGLELDSGTTYAGDTSFPSTSGSTETGHAGNGYARITRLQDAGYEAEIEYLRSTGTQYIDTGIKGASDIKIVIDGKYNSISSNQGHGSYVSPIFYLGVYSSKFIFRSGSSSATSPVSANTNRHVFSMENGVGKVDNTSYTIGTYSGNEGDYLYLFARKKSSGVDLPAGFWLYSCKIYKAGVLVRDFIPVRIGQTGYLYDSVSGNLFGNIGTGSFTLGPDV